MSSIKIFSMTHKKFEEPTDPIYIPLHVGRCGKPDLGYLGDDTGENISSLNCYYSELTGVYWVWKNISDADYVGICHYRRFLLNEDEKVFTAKEIETLMGHYDMLTSMKLDLNFSYFYGFKENHSPSDLEAINEVIKELYPDFYPLYEKRIHERHTYFGNMMICSKALFDEYCAFLFPIFETLHPRIKETLDSYDPYHRRLYGFISEFILMVWAEYKGLRVKGCKVGMIGEKQETLEVIAHIFELFAEDKIPEAKDYFIEVHKKRPDILMEASDINGYLHLCLQAISTWEFEMAAYGEPRFDIHAPQRKLLDAFHELNGCIQRAIVGEHFPEDDDILSQWSDVAKNVATKLHQNAVKRSFS